MAEIQDNGDFIVGDVPGEAAKKIQVGYTIKEVLNYGEG